MVRYKDIILISLVLTLLGLQRAWGEDTWVTHARAYIEADRVMAQHGVENAPTFPEDLERRYESEKRFKESVPPSSAVIEAMLNSEDVQEQTLASVAVGLSGSYSPDIIKRLVINLGQGQSFDLKRYTLFALTNIEPEELKPYENMILNTIEAETNEQALADEMLFLIKLPAEKSARTLTNILLKAKTNSVKRMAYGILHNLGLDYKERALSELEKRGERETLMYLKEMDSESP